MKTLADSYELIMAALAIWREARGEPVEGKTAIWNVLKNRLASKRWGKTMPRVVLAPWQFSAFNAGDPNAVKFPVPEDTAWQECLAVVSGNGPDITKGSMFYYAKSMANPPYWAAKMVKTLEVGNHVFLKEKREA